MDPWERYAADDPDDHETNGMIALYPSVDGADQLSVQDGLQPKDLHVTLVYFHECIGSMPPELIEEVENIAVQFSAFQANVFARSEFNFNGGEFDPCAVYTLSDSSELVELYSTVMEAADSTVDLGPQHVPWIPHITIGYNMALSRLKFTGYVLFDRIAIDWGGEHMDFQLL